MEHSSLFDFGAIREVPLWNTGKQMELQSFTFFQQDISWVMFSRGYVTPPPLERFVQESLIKS